MRRYLTLALQTSPHLSAGGSVPSIMWNVSLALLPVAIMAVYTFGLGVLLLILVSVVSCVLSEALCERLRGRKGRVLDGSAVLTGFLLALTLPPAFPLWMAALGGVVSIVVGKAVFGGLGWNVFNPALVGRAFLQASFPVDITTWVVPFGPDRFASIPSSTLALPGAKPTIDAVTGATPLSALADGHGYAALGDLFLGATAGSVGETSAILILLGGLYLAFRGMLDWRIPTGILASVVGCTALAQLFGTGVPSPPYMLFSGGLMLGAFFMATDMVTSPVTPRAVWCYAVLIGALVVAIRLYGALPEGVMYAILFGNAVGPLFDRLSQPRVYGTAPAGQGGRSE